MCDHYQYKSIDTIESIELSPILTKRFRSFQFYKYILKLNSRLKI